VGATTVDLSNSIKIEKATANGAARLGVRSVI
jgi:hypothetical protein